MLRRVVALVCVVAGWSLCWSTANAETEKKTPGISVGEMAAEFELADSAGRKHSLESLLKDHKAVALVFHRSADW